MDDAYWSTPQGTYEERRQAYLEYASAHSGGGRTGFFSQIARLELQEDVDEQAIREAIDYVYTNLDCNDFTMGGLLRILYRFHDSLHISHDLITDIEQSVLWDCVIMICQQ